eukprot:scaffold909_cov121-Isochrysis_galbana.AAC.1
MRVAAARRRLPSLTHIIYSGAHLPNSRSLQRRQMGHILCDRRDESVRRLVCTLEMGEPSTRLQTASRATLIRANEPRMCTLFSASTMRVRVAFSMAYLALPSLPAMRPMARARWSPLSILTSVTWNDSTYRSSTRRMATQSAAAKPSI